MSKKKYRPCSSSENSMSVPFNKSLCSTYQMNSHRNNDPMLIVNQLVLGQVAECSET
jgi:hypothetical protein